MAQKRKLTNEQIVGSGEAAGGGPDRSRSGSGDRCQHIYDLLGPSEIDKNKSVMSLGAIPRNCAFYV